MSEYPCIICQGGDVYSNVVCVECEERIEDLKEFHESIERMIRNRNDINGYISSDLSSEIDKIAYKYYNEIIHIKIDWERINDRCELRAKK